MQARELAVPGAWELTPAQYADDRGTFLEWYTDGSAHETLGHPLGLAQANLSVSAAGVVRGVHYADVPPGQAKHVTCVRGAVLDVVVDLRVGSPTFGAWDAVLLDDVDRRVVHLSEGLGHAFCSLEDGSTVVYLCSAGYAPEREHGIDPLDPALGITWPERGRDGTPLTVQVSPKDAAAPTLAVALAAGALPQHDAVSTFRDALRSDAARPGAPQAPPA